MRFILRSRTLLALVGLIGLPAVLDAQVKRPELTRHIPLDIICGPQATLAVPPMTMKVLGGPELKKRMFGPGDSVLINAGTSRGINAGQHYFVRRVIEDRFTKRTSESAPLSIHTAGWLTIVDAQAGVSTARISEACDGIMEGDFLEAFVLPEIVAPIEGGQPDFAHPGHVVLGDDRRQIGGNNAVMVIDRGSDHGVRAGQRLTIFREAVPGSGSQLTIGMAIVVSTQHETSLVRIESLREAIQVGDKVAIHR